MSNTSPYELRYQMFETARNVLVDEYWAAKEHRQAMIEFQSTFGNTDGRFDIPDYPDYPTLTEVMSIAKQINEFVSNE